jgi:hypothetical protein
MPKSGLVAACKTVEHRRIPSMEVARPGRSRGYGFETFEVMSKADRRVPQASSIPDSSSRARSAGGYYDRSRRVRSSPPSYDADAARRLWEVMERICGPFDR